jgi:hypothetical protein
MPDFYVPMNTDRFAGLETQLAAEPSVVLTKTDDLHGTLATSQVTLGYAYDAQDAQMNVNILQKHGIAKFASTDTIKEHVLTLLNK